MSRAYIPVRQHEVTHRVCCQDLSVARQVREERGEHWGMVCACGVNLRTVDGPAEFPDGLDQVDCLLCLVSTD